MLQVVLPISRKAPSRKRERAPFGFETLESRVTLSATVLSTSDVQTLLQRAAAASRTQSAIIAVVDRGGNILGVRVEQAVQTAIAKLPQPQQNQVYAFAIDGAVAEARTGAFFASDAAPLTSRTIREISQSTITQREVESNPNLGNPNSPQQGPGLVAPIGLGGNFPPGIMNTTSADLFGIEQTNRDGAPAAGRGRFNVPLASIPAGQGLSSPVSYGVASGILPTAQSRGIGTLPGGIPLFKNGTLVGGIGVFFPGPNGFASYEQGFIAGIGQTAAQRTDAPLELQAEWMAFAAAGGASGLGFSVGAIGGAPALAGFDLLPASALPALKNVLSINLGGITLDLFGPGGLTNGIKTLRQTAANVGTSNGLSGTDVKVLPGGTKYLAGVTVPTGWLVTPHDAAPGAGPLTAADVTSIINAGIAAANQTRAQIRLPIGSTTAMVFAVSDKAGNILGLYRMADATYFSLDVAVAKARNTAYYNDPAQLQAVDQLPGVAPGVAFTARTFRYLALPQYPEGIVGTNPAYFSSLNAPGINSRTGENLGAPLPASVYSQLSTPLFLFTSFNAGRNFHNPNNLANQNGVIYFPGSTSLYKSGAIVGGFGASGDGVDQDDVITFLATTAYAAPSNVTRADQVSFRGVNLPYYRFPRNPTQR